MTDSIDKPLWVPQQMELDQVLTNRSDYQVAVKNLEIAKRQTGLVNSQFSPQVVVGLKEKYGTTMINIDGEARWTVNKLHSHFNFALTAVNIAKIAHWKSLK